jgi:hypothetical protein
MLLDKILAGCKLSSAKTHQILYIIDNDIKTSDRSDEDPPIPINIINDYSKDININFVTENYAVSHPLKGKYQNK